MSDFSHCQDLNALQSRVQPPQDERTKRKVTAIREKLAQVEAYSTTGKVREGLELAVKIAQEAREVDCRLVQAEALYWHGKLLQEAGQYKKAEFILHAAIKAAGESRDGLLVSRAMAYLVRVVGYKQARHQEGLSIGLAAQAILDVAGGDEALRSRLFNNMGSILWRLAEYDKALDYLQRALKLREKSLGPEHHDVASMLNNMGAVFILRGEYDKALSYLQRALTIWKKALGPQHPDVAACLNNIGYVFLRQGRIQKALASLGKALEIWEKSLGPEHPLVAEPLKNMGAVFLENKQYDKALAHLKKAFQTWERSLGPEHPLVASSLSYLATVYVHQKRFKQAKKLSERTLRICKKETCEDEVKARANFNLARVLAATGSDKQRAIAFAKQAQDIYQKTAKAFGKELAEIDLWLETSRLAR